MKNVNHGRQEGRLHNIGFMQVGFDHVTSAICKSQRYMPALKSVISLIFIHIFISCNITGDSRNTILKELHNPIQSKKAILFLKEGGATVGDSYQLSIKDIGHKLKKTEAGNTFTADSDHGATVLDSVSIILCWISNDTLNVTYNDKLRIFTQNKKVGQTYILYSLK